MSNVGGLGRGVSLPDLLRLPSAPKDGRLVITEDGLRCGAVYLDGDGGTWAWLERPATIGDWEEIVRSHGGDLDKASDEMVKRFGGHSGYMPTNWPSQSQ